MYHHFLVVRITQVPMKIISIAIFLYKQNVDLHVKSVQFDHKSFKLAMQIVGKND